MNTVFVGVARAQELVTANEAVGHGAAVDAFGDVGGRILSGLIAIGLVSMVGALVMTGPRVYEAMGREPDSGPGREVGTLVFAED